MELDHLRAYLKKRLGWADKYLTNEQLRKGLEQNYKQRFVIRTTEGDQKVWIAAWSGHTIPNVTGPSALVEGDKVPELLVHGSYKRHEASIRQHGLWAKRRMLHFVDPANATGKWRAGLEIRVDVDTREALRLGVQFRLTGNGIWLTQEDVPAEALKGISVWDSQEFSTSKRSRVEGAKPAKGAAKREPSPGTPPQEYNYAALPMASYRSPAWPPKGLDAGKDDVKEEVALAASGLAAAVAGISLQEGEEEVKVNPCTLEATVSLASEVDWGSSDPEVAEALSHLHPTGSASTEARIEPGHSSQTGEGSAAARGSTDPDPGMSAGSEARIEPGAGPSHTPGEVSPLPQEVTIGSPIKKERVTATTGTLPLDMWLSPDRKQCLLCKRPYSDVHAMSTDHCKRLDRLRLQLAQEGTEVPVPLAAPVAVPPKAEGIAEKEEEEGTDSDGPAIGVPRRLQEASRAPETRRGERELIPKTGLKLGTGKVKLLQALASADEANWKGLQKALTEAKAEGGEKAALLTDLERLAEQRKEAAAGIKEALDVEVKRIQDAQEEDEGYLACLDAQGDYMRRLERHNPTRPSAGARVLKSERLTAEIEAGVPIWVARRREKGRQRAQAKRAAEAATSAGGAKEEATLETAEQAAEARRAAARREIAEFKASLLNEEGRVKTFRRAPDSQRRKQVKRQRRAATARNDDASRDTNHAIAHLGQSLELWRAEVASHPLGNEGSWRMGGFTALEVLLIGAFILQGIGIAAGVWCGRRCRRPLPAVRTPHSGGGAEQGRGSLSSPVPQAGRVDPPADCQQFNSSQNGSIPLTGERESRGLTPSPVNPIPTRPSSQAREEGQSRDPASGSLAPANPQRSRAALRRGVTGRSRFWHGLQCPVTMHSLRWVEPCKDCVGSREAPQVREIAVTDQGMRWHKPACGHLLGRRHRLCIPCDCPEPPVREEATLRRRRNDDASRDANHAIAHWAVVLLLAMIVYAIGAIWVCYQETNPEDAIATPDTRVGSPLTPSTLTCGRIVAILGPPP